VFGLGDGPAGPVKLEIRWPDGKTETVTALKVNEYQRIVE
jgi:hypothetical protein